MIDPRLFYKELNNNAISFFAGVPDSLLKNFLGFISDFVPSNKNIITANEGAAIALAAGYHIATNKIPMVYMQNSGLGNAINPLLSLADREVYSIPMILMIGWRGEPNIKDEPQHIKQGRITPALLNTLEIPYIILSKFSNTKQIVHDIVKICQNDSKPVAILVKKGTFSDYKVKKKNPSEYILSREEALKEVLNHIPHNSIVVSTTGKLSRELFEIREKMCSSHETDFLTVGSMGHSSQIALGIAIAKPNKSVYCFDGDGSALMHLGSYALIGQLAPRNLKLIIFNNGAHDSVGGQPTINFDISLPKSAESFGIKSVETAINIEEIKEKLPQCVNANQLSLLEIRLCKGARNNLGRPTSTPLENINQLKAYLENE